MLGIHFPRFWHRSQCLVTLTLAQAAVLTYLHNQKQSSAVPASMRPDTKLPVEMKSHLLRVDQKCCQLVQPAVEVGCQEQQEDASYSHVSYFVDVGEHKKIASTKQL